MFESIPKYVSAVLDSFDRLINPIQGRGSESRRHNLYFIIFLFQRGPEAKVTIFAQNGPFLSENKLTLTKKSKSLNVSHS